MKRKQRFSRQGWQMLFRSEVSTGQKYPVDLCKTQNQRHIKETGLEMDPRTSTYGTPICCMSDPKRFCITVWKGLESYHDGSCFIFRHNDCKVNSRNTTVMLQSNLPGMCACTHFIGRHCALLDDAVLRRYEI